MMTNKDMEQKITELKQLIDEKQKGKEEIIKLLNDKNLTASEKIEEIEKILKKLGVE